MLSRRQFFRRMAGAIIGTAVMPLALELGAKLVAPQQYVVVLEQLVRPRFVLPTPRTEGSFFESLDLDVRRVIDDRSIVDLLDEEDGVNATNYQIDRC